MILATARKVLREDWKSMKSVCKVIQIQVYSDLEPEVKAEQGHRNGLKLYKGIYNRALLNNHELKGTIPSLICKPPPVI